MIHEEMKPCPKCGKTHLATIVVYHGQNIEKARAITCRNCDFTSPYEHSQLMAEESWNSLPRNGE